MGFSASVSLVWFHRDLRLQDNPALANALASGAPVIALYIHDPMTQWAPGGASRWYLHQSLLSLQNDLSAIGIPMIFRSGEPYEVLGELIRQINVNYVYWNQVIEPDRMVLDQRINSMLQGEGIAVENFPDDTLLPPSQVCKADGTPFKVFTPFWRHVQRQLQTVDFSQRLIGAPASAKAVIDYDPNSIEKLRLLDANPWHEKLHNHWQPGENANLNRLSGFLTKRINGYGHNRDFPAQEATSGLSAALHFGEISVVRVYDLCQNLLNHETNPVTRNDIHRFLAEIGWREFARHVLVANPQTHSLSMNPKFDHPGMWESDAQDSILHSWQRGQTGVALVDAGMRELWETGRMHNRVRMVVASYLTKNLGIHWLKGARWFWETLVDADLASNTLGWQWVAGCGVGAAPYYRIFNPELQAKKFDPRGEYLRRWLGDELAPPSLIDLKAGRERALERYNQFIRA